MFYNLLEVKPRTQLYDLIRSLTRSEKRYFRIFSSRHVIGEQNNYLKLFDFIDKQDVYDEERIRAHFRGDSFAERLPFEKNYLTKLILKSLNAYHADSTPESRVRNLILNAEILIQKGLYDHSYRIIKKAERLVSNYERIDLLPEILRVEKKLLSLYRIGKEGGKGNNRWDAISRKVQRVAIGISNLYACWYASQEATELLRLGKMRVSAREREKLSKLAQTLPPLRKLSFEGKLYYYDFLSKKSALEDDQEGHYNWLKRLVKLWHNSDKQIEVQIESYLSTLNNYLVSQVKTGRLQDALATIDRMKFIPEKYPGKCKEEILTRIFVHSTTHEQYICISLGSFEQAGEMLESASRGLHLFQRYINTPQKLQMIYGMSYLAFGAGQYRTALKWNNEILNSKDLHVRADLHVFSRIMNLIIHYELGNTDILDSLLRSTYRFLKKKKMLFLVEKLIIDFIRLKIPRINTQAELRDAFNSLDKELHRIAKIPEEALAFDYFDLRAWTDSKINRCSFAESKQKLHNRRR